MPTEENISLKRHPPIVFTEHTASMRRGYVDGFFWSAVPNIRRQ